MDASNLNQAQQRSLSSVYNSPDLAATSAPQENVLQRLLPTVGSIAVPALGALLAPETGGLSLLAAAGLSGLGSAAGKGIENATSGQDITNGLGGATAEGAAGGLLGGIGGKLLGKIGGSLMQNADGAAERLGVGQLKDEFGGVSAATRQNLNMNSTAGAFKNYGLPFNSSTIDSVSPVVTGGADSPAGQAILHKGTVAAMSGAGPVDVSGVQALAQRIAGSPDMLSNTGAGQAGSKAFLSDVVNRLGQTQLPAEGTGVGSLSAADPGSVFEAQQALEKAGYSAKNDTLSQAYKDVAKELDNSLQKAGANDHVAEGLYSQDDLQKLSQISPKLAEQAAGVKTVAENRALQRPFVQASLLSKAAKKVGEGAFTDATAAAPQTGGAGVLGKLGGMFGGGGLTGMGELGGAGMSVMGNPALGLPLMAGSAALGAIGSHPGAVGGALSALGGSAVPGVLSQLATHAPSLGGEPVTDTANDQLTQQGGAVNPYQTQGPQSSATSSNPSLAWAGLFAPSIVPSLQNAQKAATAQPVLNALESSYAKAGGGQGTGGGLLSEISSLVPGTAAYQYKQQEVQAAAAISQATGMPLPSVLAAMPSLMANQGGAQNALGGLQGALSSMQGQPQFGGSSVLSSIGAQ